MDKIFFENFRCFRKMQTVPLSPLTLLVGENSTGKTSFLGLVNALVALPFMSNAPDFKRAPYDLGSFDEIVHHRGARGDQATSFIAGFESKVRTASEIRDIRVGFDFTKEGTAPFPMTRSVASGDVWGIERFEGESSISLRVGTKNGEWEKRQMVIPTHFAQDGILRSLWSELSLYITRRQTDQFIPKGNSTELQDSDKYELEGLADTLVMLLYEDIPLSIAPVRSSPRRTYNPARPYFDPGGDYAPMLLAQVSADDTGKWAELKGGLEQFGRDAGLFDDIQVKRLGKSGSDPFQLQVRKHNGRHKGPWRNLVDVGYGVSQALPVITGILQGQDTRTSKTIYLLQQPEVHLHPSAQAALGSFFCQVAGPKKQLIVETHSDHLIDRIRMDIRDGRSALKPEDVTVLYFERNGQEVDIHPIGFDELGNVVGAPDTYRRFFMEEVTRSILGPEAAGVS